MKKIDAASREHCAAEKAKAEKKRSKAQSKKMRAQKRAETRKQNEIRRTATFERRRQARRLVYGKIRRVMKNNENGFDYSNVGFRRRVELTVDGGGSEIAARFGRDGVEITDMSKSGGKTRFKIRKKDLHKAIAILEQMCYNFKVGKTYGFTRMLAFIPARIGLTVGIVAAAIAVNIAYSYVWRIEIDGNDKISDAAIVRVLENAGMSAGVKKADIDAKRISSAVSALAGIADASAEIAGTTLKVRVLEADDYTVHDRSTMYVSRYDATITRIVMRSGTSFVKRGDAVKAGDLLADGSVYSTGGELMYVGDLDGDIYGNVSITFTARLPRTAVEYRRTGNSVKMTAFRIFGFDVFEPKVPYSSYETVASTANYDVLIPLYVTTYEFFETSPVEAEVDAEALAQSYAESKAQEAEMLDGKFKTSYTISECVGGMYEVHIFLSGEARISVGI